MKVWKQQSRQIKAKSILAERLKKSSNTKIIGSAIALEGIIAKYSGKNTDIKNSIEDFKIMKNECIIYDIIYNPIKTLFLKIAERHGFKNFNGLEYLLDNGVYSFKLFLSISNPNKSIPM